MATGSALLLRRVLIFTRAGESKKTLGEEDGELLSDLVCLGFLSLKSHAGQRLHKLQKQSYLVVLGNAAWQGFDLLQQQGRNHDEKTLPIIVLSTGVLKCV